MKEMKIKSKILLVISLTSLVAIGGLYFYMSRYVKEDYLTLENDQINSDVQRINEALGEIISTTESKVSDWANWDDPYLFVQGKAPKFIEQNFSPEDQSAKLLQNDFQIFLNTENEIIYKHCWNLLEDKKCDVPEEIISSITSTPKDAVFSGITPFQNGAAILAVKLLLKSDGTGTPSGRIVFGRFLNKLIEEKLSSLTKLDIKIVFDPKGVFKGDTFPENYYVEKNQEDFVNIFESIKSIKNDAIGGMIIKKDRKVLAVYDSNKFFNFFVLSALFIVVLIWNYVAVKVFVINPLQNLLGEVLKIKESKNSNAQVHVETGDEIGELASSVNDMLKSIEENSKQLESQKAIIIHNSKMSTLGEMAGGIAHEINSPLNAIFLKIDIIRKALLQDKKDSVEKNIESIKLTVERIAKIVKGLKSYSRESSLDEIERVNLPEIIKETLTLCNEKIKLSGIELKLNGPEKLVVSMASVQFSQALLNLINNASDAVEGLDDKWINIEWGEKEDFISVSVTDSGNGIPKETREKMMNPFYTTKGVGKGTGLGLSISKGLIESQGGALTYDEASSNTKFIVTIPKNGLSERLKTA